MDVNTGVVLQEREVRAQTYASMRLMGARR
jgi:hypothetical protein